MNKDLHKKIVETIETLQKIKDEGLVPVSYLWPIDVDEEITEEAWLKLVNDYKLTNDNDLRDLLVEMYEGE